MERHWWASGAPSGYLLADEQLHSGPHGHASPQGQSFSQQKTMNCFIDILQTDK
jgi:hypothetical protein